MRYGPAVRYCPTARNFYRIRRILTETLELPRAAIRPTSTFAALIPPQKRRLVQQRLRREGLKVLVLHFSPLQAGITFTAPIVFLLLTFPVFLAEGLPFLAGLSLVVSTIFGSISHLVMLNWATETSPTFTLKDAVARITRVRDYLKAGYEMTPRDELFLRLCAIIGDNLGVDPETLTEDTRFHEDIGAD
jgi:hypothetical protein